MHECGRRYIIIPFKEHNKAGTVFQIEGGRWQVAGGGEAEANGANMNSNIQSFIIRLSVLSEWYLDISSVFHCLDPARYPITLSRLYTRREIHGITQFHRHPLRRALRGR